MRIRIMVNYWSDIYVEVSRNYTEDKCIVERTSKKIFMANRLNNSGNNNKATCANKNSTIKLAIYKMVTEYKQVSKI